MTSILAYFDAGPGSLLVQTIAAGSAGFLVFVKFARDRFRQKFAAKFRERIGLASRHDDASSAAPFSRPKNSGAEMRGRCERKSEHASAI
jgi:hypothetical protein